jgi:hypothetical protein
MDLNKYLIAHSEWIDLIPSADEAKCRLSAIVQEILETPAQSRSEVFIKSRVSRRFGTRAKKIAILREAVAFATLDELDDFERDMSRRQIATARRRRARSGPLIFSPAAFSQCEPGECHPPGPVAPAPPAQRL